MKNCLLACILLIGPFVQAFAVQPKDSLLGELDRVIQMRPVFLKEKQQQITRLKKLLKAAEPNRKAVVYYRLYNEYKSFINDSAFFYSTALLTNAYQLRDQCKIDQAKLNVSFTLLSAGMLKETLDTLQSITPTVAALPDSSRRQYFSLLARTYYDLSDYSRDQYYSPKYHNQGNEYLQQALALCQPNTLDYYYFYAWYNMRIRKLSEAIGTYEHLIKSYRLNYNQFAIAASSLSAVYSYDQQNEKAIIWMAQAAIADIKSSNHETVASRILAELLYKQGDTKSAYRYIKLALDDASFYGARHRKLQVSDILPIIEGNQLVAVEAQKKLLQQFLIVLAVLTCLVILFAVIILKQNSHLKKTKISLAKSNQHLLEINYRLQEANKIKEEYIGHFFDTISGYIEKIDTFKKVLTRKLATKRIEEVTEAVRNINLKTEREEMFYSFDTTFLKIFPGFLSDFNALFKKEDQYKWVEKQPLCPELRIFALIRLGIKDSEKIAKILDYSLNTIYAYKTKVKNRSIIPNEKFEDTLMEIKAS
jgi:tetratricopeptide (TPR) repeat protein